MIKKKSKIFALIPAAGIGSRMKIKYPKQYIKISGKTIIEHTLITLLKEPRISKIIVLINVLDNFFQKLDIANNSMIQTVIGGSQRSYSVLAGINYLTNTLQLNDCWTLIHDAVRPCLHKNDLKKIINYIDNNFFSTGGILGIPIHNTIKYLTQKKIKYTIERNKLWQALTPQFFPLNLLKTCLNKTIKDNIKITDDSSALEYCGYYPSIIRGRVDNFKLTQPEDLKLIKLYLSNTLI